jgi:competence protein ComEC
MGICFFVVYYFFYERIIKKEIGDVFPKKEEIMSLHFLDIGQGDASLIDFPNGERVLIDCAKDSVILEALGRVMPFYERSIEYLIITNPDRDHYGGCIDVLRRFEVKHIFYNGFPKKDAMWNTFLMTANEEKQTGADIVIVTSTKTWQIGEAHISFLYPNHDIAQDPRVPSSTEKISVNNTSIVTKISYGSQDILFPGDAEAAEERYLVNIYGKSLDVEMLKLAHHCSQTSSIQEFINATTPQEVICSLGRGNSYGHPHHRVLRRVERAGARIWRTDLNGDILMSVTKDGMQVIPSRISE